ncbi:MAG TPA: phosphatidate cytidylyltransferase [Bacteroidales bacterium]|nr:phosphatidate cytidylyltransferase [Bacteroidales bacterium]
MSDLQRRTITGAVIVLFLLAGFLLHPVSFFLTGAILLTGAMWEYYQIVKLTGNKALIYQGLCSAIFIYTLSTLVAAGLLGSKLLLLVIIVFPVFAISELYRNDEKPFDSLAHTVFPLFWIVLPFSLFPFAAFGYEGISAILPHGTLVFSPGILIGFFLLTWSNDTGAYLVGVSVGKHRLMERISPKKSWEGFIGGIITAAVVGWALTDLLGTFDHIHWIIISFIISVTGTYGDLAESMLKRSAGIKDSGKILPGHGGFLDRFDSTILSFPLVYLFIILFG